MRKKLTLIINDNFIKGLSIASLALFIILSALIIYVHPKLPPFIPIFNSMPWGERRLFSSDINILFPAILSIIIIVNAIFGIVIYKRFTLISRILAFNSTLFVVLGLLAYLQILFLVF